jgi:hypothetical protein
MNTVFDAISIAIFAGLVVLFLQRTLGEERDFGDDPMWRYLVAAFGCAFANYAGNEISALAGSLAIGITIIFIILVLKPFPNFPRR